MNTLLAEKLFCEYFQGALKSKLPSRGQELEVEPVVFNFEMCLAAPFQA
jgi:hypothetical protein